MTKQTKRIIGKDRDALLELAERCEKASADEQRALIWECGLALRRAGDRMRALFDAGGFESAALTLVPEGWDTHLHIHATIDGSALAFLTDRGWLNEKPDGRLLQADAATPALALCAASLRAHAAMIPPAQSSS